MYEETSMKKKNVLVNTNHSIKLRALDNRSWGRLQRARRWDM